MNRAADEPALVLHVRPYRETSAIVNLLTLHHGRVAVVARGARNARRGSPLQPFNRVRVGWQGRGNLGTLVAAELEAHVWLTGDAQAAGFYVLELLNRLLGERESVPNLYLGACRTLEGLRDGPLPLDLVLRRFESLLLDELGYGLEFGRDAGDGGPVDGDGHYRFDPEIGFSRVAEPGAGTYAGHVLLDIAAGEFGDRAARVAAKRIHRRALAPLLGPRPLTSRRLLTGRAQPAGAVQPEPQSG